MTEDLEVLQQRASDLYRRALKLAADCSGLMIQLSTLKEREGLQATQEGS